METRPPENSDRPYYLEPKDRSPQQSALIKRVIDGPRGRVPPNLYMWLNNVDFAEVAEKFGEYTSQKARFQPLAKEIIILLTASHWRSTFEWYHHAPHAKKHGATAAQLDALWNKTDPKFADPIDQLTYEVAFAVIEKHEVSDDLYKRAIAKLGHVGVSDIIGLAGLYTMIAQSLAFYKIEAPKE